MPEILHFSPVLEQWKRWDMGTRQRAGRFWRDHATSDPTFARVVMGVELFLGSDVAVRVARVPLAVTSALDGRVRQFLPGLVEEPELDHVTSLGDQSASARSLNFAVPGFLVKPSDILAKGRTLAGLGEVALYVDGMDYDLRLVLMRGDVSGGVQFGAESEFLELQLSDPRETQSQYIPGNFVTRENWPLTNKDAVGLRYPYVINGYTRVPGLRVLDDHAGTGLKWLVASPGWEFTIDATFLNGSSVSPSTGPFQWSEEKTKDADGTRVLLVNFGTSAGSFEDTDQVYCNISQSSGTTKSAIQSIQSILQGFTSLGLAGLNPDLFSRAHADMPATPPNIMVNGSGKQAVRAMDLIEGGILDSFPMINMVYEGRGLGPVVYDRRVGPARAKIDGILEAGKFPLIERESLYEEIPKSEVYNSFQVRYAYNALADTYDQTVRRDARNSAACAMCQEWVGGERPYDVIESPYITEDEQANYIIDWLVAHYAIPSYYVEWSVLPWVFARYRRGMRVLYSDSADVPVFTSAVATIERLTYRRDRSVIGLRVWHPFWDEDLTGLVGGS